MPIAKVRKFNIMQTVAENVSAASAAMEAVRAHPMAAKVSVDRSHLTVMYPQGFGLDGVRVTLANGKRWAAEQALTRMEREWTTSYPAGRAP